ncbi:MAG: putative aminopeptidase, partial [Bryobacterales bacterium]|nr:putative aminopeptidase [Bryobacterales bacterium]
SDEFAGRGPGTSGEQKTVAYLIAQATKLGLQPGNPDGTFIQKVPLWGIRTSGTVAITVAGKELPMTPRQDYLLSSQNPKAAIDIVDSPIVFAGYGVVAPRYGWDDYKNIDVKGKTVLILSGDPPVPDPNNPAQLDEKMFLGKALSAYGRPASKYETAYAKGAVAVLTIFTPRTGAANLTRAAQQVPREAMILRDSASEARIQAQATLSMEKAKELFAAGGLAPDGFVADAVKPGFQPVALQATVTIHAQNTLRQVDSQNVIAKVPGSDATLKNEYVVYTGHWDHLGEDGDKIYHGASDNASGAAGVLELARAFTKYRPAPRRTILFLWTTAEEKGLLGAKYYVQHPLYPLSATAANINLDYFSNWGWGRTKDISIIGIGNSTLDDLVQAAAQRQGRVVTGDTLPEQGFYFRSDHLEFANGNVPSLETSPGIDFIGKPAGYGVQKRDEYIKNDYHKVTDEIKRDWDLKGAVEDLQILLEVGYQVAQADAHPTWKPDAPYH